MAVAPPPQPYPLPRRRRRGLGWLIALLVLVVLLVAADRVAVAVANTKAAETFQSSQDLPTRPAVRIGGFPFLTQLAARELDHVDVTAKGLTLGNSGRTLRVAKVTGRLNHVHISRSFTSARAETMNADALISYADLSDTLGIPIRYAGVRSGRGRVQTTGSVTVLGQTISGNVSADPSISDNVLRFVSPRISVQVDNGSPVAVQALESVFGVPLQLGQLPFGLTFRSLNATEDGLTITLTGTNLTYDRA